MPTVALVWTRFNNNDERLKLSPRVIVKTLVLSTKTLGKIPRLDYIYVSPSELEIVIRNSHWRRRIDCFDKSRYLYVRATDRLLTAGPCMLLKTHSVKRQSHDQFCYAVPHTHSAVVSGRLFSCMKKYSG